MVVPNSPGPKKSPRDSPPRTNQNPPIKRRRQFLKVVTGATIMSAVVQIWRRAFRSSAPPSPLTHEAYVWQRNWTPAVEAAIKRAAALSNLCIFAGDITNMGGASRDKHIGPPWKVIRSYRDRVAVSWRVTESLLREGWTGPVRHALAYRIRETLEDAKAAGLEITEAQCDCDCPTRLLPGYADFIGMMKAEHPSLRWTFTALPSWLSSPSFRRLAEASDGFVLQVHWLHKGPKGAPELMDVRDAKSAAAVAASFKVPFRVALGTYGSAVVVDQAGRWLDVISEEAHYPDHETKLLEVASTPSDALALLRAWQEARPPWMTGIIWYRLPVDGDRRNWSWPQFAAVVSGEEPRADWRIECKRSNDGHIDVVLVNAGTADGGLPRRISLGASDVVAADGVMGYHCEVTPESANFIRASFPQLRAGESLSIGWVRRRREEDTFTISITP